MKTESINITSLPRVTLEIIDLLYLGQGLLKLKT